MVKISMHKVTELQTLFSDILFHRVPREGSFLPKHRERPWDLAVCAGLLHHAGWALWLVCADGAIAV